MNINERLSALRELMEREHLSAFIIPSTDAHQSEYVADHWKCREWISGFNGSAGTAVVTMNSAALWTDSRYFLAAEEQLKGTEFQLMRLKIEGTPTVAEWINEQCIMNNVQRPEVAIDGMVWSTSAVEELVQELRHQGGITLRTNLDPFKSIWKDRPALPDGKIEIQPLSLAGEDCRSKIERIRRAFLRQHADGLLISALDDIAWTLNLRGTDVHCTPVFVSYLLITTDAATLYINKEKLTAEVSAYLKEQQVSVSDYDGVRNDLGRYLGHNILLDPDETSYSLMKALKREVIRAASPVPAMKIMKNETEIKGYHAAMLRDGVAMVKFLMWLEDTMESHPTSSTTEMGIDRQLTALRAEQPLYRDLSFDTIAGYGPHGAIVHYEATPETDIPLEPHGLLLLDSGAQYQDGTTDITRTIALGPLTEDERHVYTLVLKGHIALARAVFPERATGTQLDVLARQFMWREGLNYLHGTGHGVGSYLSVHEGPHQFRMEWKPQPLLAGMTITNEPGIYLAGRFGVRIENTMLIVPAQDDVFFPLPDGERPRYLRLEPLTLCPIDKRPIDLAMLTDNERQWLNDYHQTVFDRLSPLLTKKEQQWLREATAAV